MKIESILIHISHLSQLNKFQIILKEIELTRRMSIFYYFLKIHPFRVIRNNKLINFTKPGNPGTKFKNHFEKMIKSLSLPKAAREELGIPEDAGN